MSEVYITNVARFLPNKPVANGEMEEYLGLISEKHSKTKGIILRNNKIKNRFYALDKNSKITHSNAEIAAASVRALFSDNEEGLRTIDLLCCGTSSPDQLMPSHGVMTHGCLPEVGSIEVTSASGVCCAGMHALKYAYLAVKAGDRKKAVALGSERFSVFLRSEKFESEARHLIEIEEDPIIAFEKDFLRWMLSDGSGAVLLEDKKAENGLSYRVDWIEGVSFADKRDTCLYAGAVKNEDGGLSGYMDLSDNEIIDESVLSIKQDVSLLGENIVQLGVKRVKEIFDRKGISIDEVDYLLPHISSYYFEDKIYEEFKLNDMEVPKEKFFVNLDRVGNVGAASVYLMLEELHRSRKLKIDDKILLLVPESARFSYMFAWLTVC